MERNIDKIKRLEHELGRYQKKVADQAKENEAMRSRLLQAYAGNSEAQKAMDAGYEIHARRDEETMEYIIGVVPRETVEEAAAE